MSSSQEQQQQQQQQQQEERFRQRVYQLVDAGDLQELATLLHGAELYSYRVSGDEDESNPNGGFLSEEYTLLLTMAYLILDDIVSAQLLCERMPKRLKEAASLTALNNVTQHLAQKDMLRFFASTEQLSQLPEIQAHAGVTALWPLLIGWVRERQFRLIQRSYSSIGVEKCGQRLGLTAQQMVEFATSRGWQASADATMLIIPTSVSQPPEAMPSMSVQRIQQLTKYAIALE